MVSDNKNANKGYIKLFRSFTNWCWYKDADVSRVFLHCLLKAASKDAILESYSYICGSFFTTRRQLALELDITESAVRKALRKLVSSNEILCNTSSKGTLISVVKWSYYQKHVLKSKNADEEGVWIL